MELLLGIPLLVKIVPRWGHFFVDFCELMDIVECYMFGSSLSISILYDTRCSRVSEFYESTGHKSLSLEN